MPTLNLNLEHHTTKMKALDILQCQIPILLRQFGGNISDTLWRRNGDTIEFSGKSTIGSVEGTVKVSNTFIHFQTEIPWAATPFKQKLEIEVQAWILGLFKKDH